MKDIVNSYDLTMWIAILTTIMFFTKMHIFDKIVSKEANANFSLFLILVPMLIT